MRIVSTSAIAPGKKQGYFLCPPGTIWTEQAVIGMMKCTGRETRFRSEQRLLRALSLGVSKR
jgi:hypothetical protein